MLHHQGHGFHGLVGESTALVRGRGDQVGPLPPRYTDDRNSLAVDDFPLSPFYGSVYVGWDRLASKRKGYAYTGDGLVAYSRDGLNYTTVCMIASRRRPCAML